MTNHASSLVSIGNLQSGGSRWDLAAKAKSFSLYWTILFAANFLISYFSSPRVQLVMLPDPTPLRQSWVLPSFLSSVIQQALLDTTIELILAWTLAWALCRFFPSLRGLLGVFTRQEALPQTTLDQQLDGIMKRRAELNAAQLGNIDRLLVMREIDARVRRLAERAGLILGSIAIALVVAAFVVIFAGRLTSLDAAAVSNIDKARSELSNAEERLGRLYRFAEIYKELDNLKQKAASGADLPSQEILSKQIAEKAKEVSSLRSTISFYYPNPENSASAQNMITTASAHVNSLIDLLGQVEKSELLAEHGYNDWRYIIATAITRVGVVLIIVFLVQILMGLYRYNTRLITYYNSRRDLLTLWEGDQKKLKDLADVMAPPTFDFGKDPKHPLEDIIKAIGSHIVKSESGDHAHKEAKAKEKEQ